MRGAYSYNESLFTTVKLEDSVPANHPMHPIRTRVNDALAGSRPCGLGLTLTTEVGNGETPYPKRAVPADSTYPFRA